MSRQIKNWLQGYLEYTRHLEAPDVLHFWAGVATLAGALRGKVWINMGYWKWKPNFFIIYVAKPGIVAKSTTIGVGIELLREIEGIHFGPDSATWQAMTQAFAEASEVVELPGGDKIAMSCITLAVSELGTFLNPKNSEMMDVLVDLWDGKAVPWQRMTKGEGEYSIPNPWVNLVGATTPSWLSENFPEYAIGGGFTSRTLFIYAENKRHLSAYPQDLLSEDDARLKKILIDDLRIIANARGPFTLLKETKAWGNAWYKKHWTEADDTSDQMAGYLARKQTHIHKVAMILSISKRDTMDIHPEDLEEAETLVTMLEYDMGRVFERVTDNVQSKYYVLILEFLRNRKKLTKKTLWELCMLRMPLQDFDNVIQGLINAGYIRQVQKGNDLMITFLPPGKVQPSQKINLDTGVE